MKALCDLVKPETRLLYLSGDNITHETMLSAPMPVGMLLVFQPERGLSAREERLYARHIVQRVNASQRLCVVSNGDFFWKELELLATLGRIAPFRCAEVCANIGCPPDAVLDPRMVVSATLAETRTKHGPTTAFRRLSTRQDPIASPFLRRLERLQNARIDLMVDALELNP